MFRKSLSALGGKRARQPALGGRSILVPPKSPYPLQSGPVQFGQGPRRMRSTAAMRRRKNLTRLAVFIIATFLLGVFPPLRFMLVINLIADVALILYLGLALYLAFWPPVEREPAPIAVPEAPAAPAAADGGL